MAVALVQAKLLRNACRSNKAFFQSRKNYTSLSTSQSGNEETWRQGSNWTRGLQIAAAIPVFGYVGYWSSFKIPSSSPGRSARMELNFAYADKESHILDQHPYTQFLRGLPGLRESRPHLTRPLQNRKHSLTGGTLIGEKRITTWPIIFGDVEGERLYVLTHLGSEVSGSNGKTVSNGLLATFLDEG